MLEKRGNESVYHYGATNASDPAPMQFILLSRVQQLENILEIQVVRFNCL
jgi:hypothetical protein